MLPAKVIWVIDRGSSSPMQQKPLGWSKSIAQGQHAPKEESCALCWGERADCGAAFGRFRRSDFNSTSHENCWIEITWKVWDQQEKSIQESTIDQMRWRWWISYNCRQFWQRANSQATCNGARPTSQEQSVSPLSAPPSNSPSTTTLQATTAEQETTRRQLVNDPPPPKRMCQTSRQKHQEESDKI